MRRILPFVTASAALLAVGCSSNKPTYFVGMDGGSVALITWSAQQNGRANGTITDDSLSGSAPGESVTVQTVRVTVRFDGSRVSFGGNGIYELGGATITGTMSGGRLSLRAPGASGYLESAVLRSATPALYNSDLAKLRLKVTDANTAAKRTRVRTQQPSSAQFTTDQDQVSSDVTTLQTDASTLTSDVTQMSTDEQQVSTDLAQLKSDAANGQGASCENVSTVESDAATVDGDGTTVEDDGTTVTQAIDTVQGDISQLTGDLETLAKAGGSPVGDPSPQAAILQAQTAINDAVTQANSYINTVNGYLQQAFTTTNNLAGSTCGGSA
jgi:hypothetical protein